MYLDVNRLIHFVQIVQFSFHFRKNHPVLTHNFRKAVWSMGGGRKTVNQHKVIDNHHINVSISIVIGSQKMCFQTWNLPKISKITPRFAPCSTKFANLFGLICNLSTAHDCKSDRTNEDRTKIEWRLNEKQNILES